MSQVIAPLFVDTGPFFAHFNERAEEYATARTVFEGIRSGELGYGPLFTSRYVLSELATLLRRRVGHTPAVSALELIRASSSFNVLPVGDDAFDRTCEQFARYDDRILSFVDHSTGVLANEHGIDHVFTFDPDDFRTLGFRAVPDDTGEA